MFNLQGPRAQITCFNAQMVHAFHGPQRADGTAFQFVKMDLTCLQLVVSYSLCKCFIDHFQNFLL